MWGRIRSKLDRKEFETLRKEQRKWIQKKEKAAKAEGDKAGNGSIKPLLQYTKAYKLTKARVYELASYLR